MDHDKFIVPPGKKIRLKDYDPASTGPFKNKEEASATLQQDIERLSKYQQVLYAENKHALLIILQGMDASGKDGAIRHVMSGLNPQGIHVHSFKTPSTEELQHDFLWRTVKDLPERGQIGIFNRSYYEEVLIVRVHPEILELQRLPPEAKGKNVWKRRLEEIRDFEKHLARNGTVVLKFFLNISPEEQRRRLIERIDLSDKNWKFEVGDIKERSRWQEYMNAYEDAFNHSSTDWAPWYIIPADHKWLTRAAVAGVIIEKLKSLKLSYPVTGKDHRRSLLQARRLLMSEPARKKK